LSNDRTDQLAKNMKRNHSNKLLLTVIAAFSIAACSENSGNTGSAGSAAGAKLLPDVVDGGSMSAGLVLKNKLGKFSRNRDLHYEK